MLEAYCLANEGAQRTKVIYTAIRTYIGTRLSDDEPLRRRYMINRDELLRSVPPGIRLVREETS
jgi:hypothetical protein